jgi:tripartite-type tricarboxylate transporter receptor subunit TctC
VFPNAPTMQELGFNLPIITSTRGAIAPPGISKDVLDYWESFFARLVKTESWRKFVADNFFEEQYLTSREIPKMAEEAVAVRRKLYAEFGIKTAR